MLFYILELSLKSILNLLLKMFLNLFLDFGILLQGFKKYIFKKIETLNIN